MILTSLAMASAALYDVQLCFPASCTVDGDCVDPIHSLYLGPAKCCAGKCVEPSSLPERLIGDSCNPKGNTSLCVGPCASGSFCSAVDNKCHALHGSGCACSSNAECLHGNCVFFEANTTLKLCQVTYSTPLGGFCKTNDQCQSRYCNGTACQYLKPGDDCSSASSQSCGTNSTCRYNDASNSFKCFTLCQTGVANCCEYHADCLDQGACVNGTCLPPLAPGVSGLGESCVSVVNCKNDTWICDAECNATSCSSTEKVCQLPNQFPPGATCYSSVQCASNSSCVFVANASRCEQLGTIPAGQSCTFDASCAPPAQICGPSSNGTLVCKVNGSTPIGDLCIRKPAPLNDCVAGAQCITNGSTSTCLPFLALGAKCLSNNQRTCIGGSDSCVPPVLGGLCVLSSSNCACVTPRTVPDGGACRSSVQCQGASSFCAPINATCMSVIGQPCNSPSDCGEGYPKFDCNCNHKCYLLNASIPSILPIAPPTPAGQCSKEQAAWLAVQPAYFKWAYSLPGYVDATSFQNSIFKCGPNSFVSSISPLNASIQAIAIAFACCVTCPFDIPFNSLLTQGHQVNCASKTIVTLPDTCDDLRGALAFVSCWKTLPTVKSSASDLFPALGVLLVLSLILM